MSPPFPWKRLISRASAASRRWPIAGENAGVPLRTARESVKDLLLRRSSAFEEWTSSISSDPFPETTGHSAPSDREAIRELVERSGDVVIASR